MGECGKLHLCFVTEGMIGDSLNTYLYCSHTGSRHKLVLCLGYGVDDAVFESRRWPRGLCLLKTYRAPLGLSQPPTQSILEAFSWG
jgi:hypothetical protein